MDLNHAMYTPTSQEFESIPSGQGPPHMWRFGFKTNTFQS
jgi:hypothetical protein